MRSKKETRKIVRNGREKGKKSTAENAGTEGRGGSITRKEIKSTPNQAIVSPYFALVSKQIISYRP